MVALTVAIIRASDAQAAPSLSQAQRIKKLAQEGNCTLDITIPSIFWIPKTLPA